MWNLNWLSSNWWAQICFALAGLIFVLCQFLVGGSTPKLDELPSLQADGGRDGSFQDLTTYFDSIGQSTNGLNQRLED